MENLKKNINIYSNQIKFKNNIYFYNFFIKKIIKLKKKILLKYLLINEFNLRDELMPIIPRRYNNFLIENEWSPEKYDFKLELEVYYFDIKLPTKNPKIFHKFWFNSLFFFKTISKKIYLPSLKKRLSECFPFFRNSFEEKFDKLFKIFVINKLKK